MKADDAAKRLLEIASMVETSPQGRIFVERVSTVFLNEGGEAYLYRVGIELLKRDGLIDMHDSGTFFRFTEKGAQRFAREPRRELSDGELAQESARVW